MLARLLHMCSLLLVAACISQGSEEAGLAAARNACVDFVCTNSSVYAIYGNACLGLNMSIKRDCKRLCPTFVSVNRNCDGWGLSCVQACMANQQKLGFPTTKKIIDD
ncbi:hypothetical protein H310_12238 [Aphanomyces invadans]|uniref:Uncharacterized protein n=1 Tax=Aphanomyces invadans TaxID=157072 RepID=A0A024TIP4_9STRA|nr:hypothetical protein H310_12238 [Aphanomyces invadans]ETV93893.1 hypothetical protein H310_12238 [Aphanomyces invadans]RHY27964.1 hypothetical protein DYB32_006391 [Aphanomyces invadans]|eukprot:XP_008877453.1 hypothetical protein H310_12238 [Aphanomyces invadans]